MNDIRIEMSVAGAGAAAAVARCVQQTKPFGKRMALRFMNKSKALIPHSHIATHTEPQSRSATAPQRHITLSSQRQQSCVVFVLPTHLSAYLNTSKCLCVCVCVLDKLFKQQLRFLKSSLLCDDADDRHLW